MHYIVVQAILMYIMQLAPFNLEIPLVIYTNFNEQRIANVFRPVAHEDLLGE